MKTSFCFSNACDHEASICVSNSALGGGEFILTKYPVEIDIVRWALFLDPNLWVVCVVRDPRDMIVSYHGAFPETYWASLKFWSFFLAHYENVANHSRFIVLRYEDFVQDPDAIQKQLVARIPGLKTQCAFSEYHNFSKPGRESALAMKKLRPIESQGVGSWKTHLERVKQQIQCHGGLSESLIQFGYEASLDWEEALKDVEIVDSLTQTGEFFSRDDLRRRGPRKVLTAANILAEHLGLIPDRIFRSIKNLYRRRRK